MFVPRTPRLYKHKGTYSLVFYDPRTQSRKWVSLGTGDKRAAERRAAPIILAYERQEWDPWRDTWSSGVPLTEALSRWTAAKKRDKVRPRTISNVEYLVERLAGALPSGLTTDAVTTADVRRIIESPPSDTGRASYRRTLSSFFGWCAANGLCASNPVLGVRVPRIDRKAPYYLSRTEADRLIAEAGPAAQVIRFAIGSGLRRGELISLRPHDVDLDGGTIHVRAATTKGRADRYVPLSSWSRYAAPSVPFDYTADHLTKSVRKAANAAGLPACHLHTLRHTFASWLRVGGAPIDRIQYWLGHRDIATTMIYAHIDPHAIKTEMGRAFERGFIQ